MLILDFMVNSILKNTQRYFCGLHGWNVLTRMQRRRKRNKDSSCASQGARDNQIATNAKLLDFTQESYRFSADLIETIN